MKAIRILGIDTSLRSTGVGVVAAEGSRMSAVEYGTLKNPARRALSECLTCLSAGIVEIIDRTGPEAAAIEGAFFSKNANTAMILGEARGVVIAACAARGIPVYEYAPRRVKQAVVGFGGAEKEQVRKMVMSLLALGEEPPEDASDALALAICHLHGRTGVTALMPEPI
jgi:crossover junction endodeoxyribonuclease RuvC